MHIVITYRHGEDASYLDLIKMAFLSAKKYGYKTVLVSDIELDCDHRIDFPADKEEHLMNWILAAQLAYIESPLFNQNSVIFSPDALILKPLEEIFRLDFDMAFTTRNNPRWPINNGVIFLKNRYKKKIGFFWRDCLSICKSYSLDVQQWYGDQQSLHDAYVYGHHTKQGLRVLLLPCSIYNSSPPKNMGKVIDQSIMKNSYIIHMKGKRKDMMEKYWELVCTKV